jgi:diamine N-acetyltransferase
MYIKQLKIELDNEKFVIRLLKSSDEEMLTRFFKKLSYDTKKKYSPHAFDHNTSKEICRNIDKDCKRVICIHDKLIVGYCIMYFKLRKWEKLRYDKAKMFIKNEDVCTMAPCVLDEFQHMGVGSKMFSYAYYVAKICDKNIIILWGGVVVKNHSAVNYYKKMNFKILGKWLHPLSKVMCYDMYLKI